jgi:hypothetical protein
MPRKNTKGNCRASHTSQLSLNRPLALGLESSSPCMALLTMPSRLVSFPRSWPSFLGFLNSKCLRQEEQTTFMLVC